MSAHPAPLIVNDDLPSDVADAFVDASRVACDVETSGLDWLHDRLGTYQLFTDSVGVVIVRVRNGVPKRLISLLENQKVEKIFHHAPFDLRFTIKAWNVRPASIRCTKVASKLLNRDAPNEMHSLQQLTYRHLGIWLPKGATRTSDWSSADLTPAQIAYAARDVMYLPDLLESLERHLRTNDLRRQYDACCDFLPTRAMLDVAGYSDIFAY